MDVLRRSGLVPVRIPEYLGHLGGLSILILIPGRILLGCGLLALRIGVVDNGLIGNLCLVADGSGALPFGPALVTYGRGTIRFCRDGKVIRLPFPFDQNVVGLIHGLAFFAGFPFCYVTQGIRIRTDGGIVLSCFIGSFGHRPRIADGQIALVIIGSRGIIAQIHRVRRQRSRRQSQPQRQGQSKSIYPPGIFFRLECSFPWFRAISDTTTQLQRTLLQMTL